MINSVHCYLGGGVPGGGVVPQETVQMTRAYCGNHIYRNDSLERVLMPSGHLDAQGAFYAYVKDYLGSVRVVVAPDGTVAEVNHYYPYGMLMAAEAGVQPHKYGGKELDRQNGLDWYDSQARWYDPALGRTTTMDPKAEEYPAISPYAWCAGNPVRFVDPTGEDVNVNWFSWMADGAYFNQFFDDLAFITGLTLSKSEDGLLNYAKDDDGNAVVSKDQNGESLGSATARNHLMTLIDSDELIEIDGGKRSTTNNDNRIGINVRQILSFINGSRNLDSRTLGFGMTFLHESFHTKVGGNLKDDPMGTGDVVDRMNVIRNELNQQGHNFGQRVRYRSIELNGHQFIPFDKEALRIILSGFEPIHRKFIKF